MTVVSRGTDSGAPSLAGAVGSMITLLDYFLVTKLGWEKAFTGTNRAAYRAPAGNRFYLAVDDTNAFFTNFRGYESMTDASTGSNPFPTATQLASGIQVYKSSSATANVVGTDWHAYGNDTMFHLFVNGGTTSSTTSNYVSRYPFTFGDFISHKIGDTYNTMISGLASTISVNNTVPHSIILNAANSNPTAGLYMARSYTQIGSAVQGDRSSNPAENYSGRMGGGSMTYPNPIVGGLMMSPIYICEGVTGVRGRVPGIWNPLHNKPLTHLDTFAGVDGLSSRTFDVLDLGYSTAGYSGQCFMETSDTWTD